MGVSLPNTIDGIKRAFELGADLVAGDPVKIYDDSGPKIEKCQSQMGNAAIFGRGYYNQMAKIGTDKYVIVYRDLASGSYGYVRVCQFDANNVITMGTAVQFYAAAVYYIDICPIGTDKFAVVYKGPSNYGYALAGSVSGTTITLGSAVNFNTGYAYYNSCCQLDTDKFVVVCKDGSVASQGIARVFEVSGLTVTFGLGNNFTSATVNYPSCCQLDTDKFAVSYYVSPNAQARIATVTGTTMSFGAASTFNAGAVYTTYMEKLASNKMGVVYRDGADGSKPNMRAVEFTGTTIGTWGTEFSFHNDYCYYSAIAYLEDNKFVAIISSDTPPYKAQIFKCNLTGVNISIIGAGETFTNARAYYVDIIGFGSDKYAFAYYDASSAATGKTIVVEGGLNSIPLCAGILAESGSIGEIKVVDLLNGITRVLSSLTPGGLYYIQDDGSISGVSSVYPIGLALETDELFISKVVEGG